VLGLRPAPEFEAWLREMGIFTGDGPASLGGALPLAFQRALTQLP
jgi:ethanolamine ammonia-lyase large subunit